MGFRKEHRLSYVLEIAGLTIRYYAGVRPPTKALRGVSTEGLGSYVDVQAITDLSVITEESDWKEGFVKHSPLTITLASNSPNPRSSNDPATVFGRVRPRAASVRARVAQSFPMLTSMDLPGLLYVEESLVGLSYPRIVHVGQEAMVATGAGDNATGDYILIAERGSYPSGVGGVLDTRQAPITVDDQRGIEAWVTTPEITSWQRRIARLRAAEVSPSGEVLGDYEDLFVGFIREEPDLSDLGKVTLQLSPLTALIDSDVELKIGAVTLLDGWHEWHKVTVPGVEGAGSEPVGYVFEHYQHVARGRLYRARQQGLGDFVGDDFAARPSGESHGALFDPSLGTDHPRAGHLYGTGVPTDLIVTGYDGARIAVEDLPAEMVDQTQVGNLAATERHTLEVDYDDNDEIIYRWPSPLGDLTLNAGGGADWGFDSTQGADGAWARVYPWGAGEEGQGADISPSDIAAWSTHAVGDGFVTCLFGRLDTRFLTIVRQRRGWRAGSFGPEPDRITPYVRRCWYPWIITDTSERTRRYVRDQWAGSTEEYAAVRVDVASYLSTVESVVADSWYQQGEAWALIAQDIDLAAANASAVLIRWDEPVSAPPEGDGPPGVTLVEHYQVAQVDSTEAVVLPDGTTAYRLYFTNPNEVASFGNWSSMDGAPCDIRPIINSLRNAHPRDLLRAYLESAVGLNLGSDLVDFNSIDRLEVPAALSQVSLPVVKAGTPLKLKSLIGGILLAAKSVVSMVRTSDGSLKLGVVNVGANERFRTSGTIAAGDWGTDGPNSTLDTAIVTAIDWATKYDEEGKELAEGSYSYVQDQLVREQGVHRLKAEIRELGAVAIEGGPGVQPEPARRAAVTSALLDVSIDLFRLYGRPRVVWDGSVGVYLGHDAYVGSNWIVSSPRLRSYDGFGVNQLVARVQRREIDYLRGKARLVLVHHEQEAGGWNASLKVTTKTNNTTLVCFSSLYSEDDAVWFVPGSDVRVVPEYDEDSAVIRGITSITDNGNGTHTVVIDAAWAGSLPARIEPVDYDDANATVRLLAFLADADDEIGDAGDPGPRVS